MLQKDGRNDSPLKDELFDYGCRAEILQMLKLPDGTIKVLVEGKSRVKIEKIGIYRTRDNRKVRVVDIQEDVRIYNVFVEMDNKMRYTTTIYGHRQHVGPENKDDLVEYLSVDKYPEYYL